MRKIDCKDVFNLTWRKCCRIGALLLLVLFSLPLLQESWAAKQPGKKVSPPEILSVKIPEVTAGVSFEVEVKARADLGIDQIQIVFGGKKTTFQGKGKKSVTIKTKLKRINKASE